MIHDVVQVVEDEVAETYGTKSIKQIRRQRTAKNNFSSDS